MTDKVMCLECGNDGGYHDYICSMRYYKPKRSLGGKVGDFIEGVIDGISDIIDDLSKD